MTTQTYVQRAADALAAELPDLDPDLSRLHLLLVLTRGVDCTLEDVHDAWAVWCDATNPEHRSLIRFDELAPDVQALDEPYRDGIVRAARRVVGEAA